VNSAGQILFIGTKNLTRVFDPFDGECKHKAESDRTVENCWQGVFDPFDGECKYMQNPTKQSKTVDKGFRPVWRRSANICSFRQNCWKQLTRVFDPFVRMFLIIAISDKSIKDAWQGSLIRLMLNRNISRTRQKYRGYLTIVIHYYHSPTTNFNSHKLC